MSNLMKIETIPAGIKSQMLELGFSEQQFKAEAINALQIWNNPKNEYLRSCTKASFLTALIDLCKIGLSLNPVKKEAYLIPRAGKICLEPSYIGLIKLLTDEGTVKNIQTNVIYENCDFDLFHDMNGLNFKHVPYYAKNLKSGNIIGVYCIANLTNEEKQFEHMTIDEINAIKEKSESYKAFKDPNKKVFSCVWDDYESEMIRKTIIRRIYKYLPRSTGKKSDYINEAVKLDESAFSASLNQITMIESLLLTSGIQDNEKEQIEREFVTMSNLGAKKCIKYLNETQIDPLDFPNSSQTDIRNKLKEVQEDERK